MANAWQNDVVVVVPARTRPATADATTNCVNRMVLLRRQ